MIRVGSVYYVYPMFKRVSWNAIAKKHLKYLKSYMNIFPIDENAFPALYPFNNSIVILHPFFYPIEKFEAKFKSVAARVKGVIGIDVADSDAISEYAASLANRATAIIVPSNFAKRSYVNSGVRVPVYVVPHGVDREWIDAPKTQPKTFAKLADHKEKRCLKFIISYQMHSEYRKGLDILIKLFKELRNERNDVALVLKTSQYVGVIDGKIGDENTHVEKLLTLRMPIRWLTEGEQMELFDLCEIYALTSRGGGFEHPPLLGLARGEIVIGARGGAWDDYMPDWGLVDSKRSGQVLPGNHIHVGRGVEMEIDRAVDRLCDVLDNLDDYRARVKEHTNKVIREKFVWDRICFELGKILLKHLREVH